MKNPFKSSLWILLGLVTTFSSCSRSQAPVSQVQASAGPSSTAGTTALLNLAYDKPAVVGASVHAEAGLAIDDMVRVVPRLAEAGCDALHVSTGVIEGALDKIVDPMSSREG